MLTKDPKGIESKIGNIPVVLVNNHNEAFYYWEKHNIRGATLIHIDAHPDIFDGVLVENSNNPKLNLEINDFICPALHYGVISSVYWINPHSTDKYIQDIGSMNGDGRKLLATKIRLAHAYEPWIRICWDEEKCGILDRGGYIFNPHHGIVITQDQIKVERDMILGIDLDAFCCDRAIHNVNWDYNGVEGYEIRIKKTTELLRMLKSPSLITIARSQGDYPDTDRTYVPHDLVEKVQKYTLEQLSSLYEAFRSGGTRK